MFKLNIKFEADSLLYSLSHFECDGHTVHMLTQQRLLPPLTSTVKSSLFMHAHSSPLSLASRLYWCHENYSCYINNGWTFSGQAVCVCVCVCVYLDRGKGGRKRGRETLMWERNTLIGCFLYVPPTGDQTHNLDMCPDWKSGPWPFALGDSAPANWASQVRASLYIVLDTEDFLVSC